MPPAVIAAGVGAAASIGGGLLASNSTKKAAQQATDTSLQTAQMNNALAQNIYSQNRAALAPYMQRGNVAGDAYNALLGLPVANDTAPAAMAYIGGPQPSALSGITYDEGQAPGAGRYLNQMPMDAAQMGAGGAVQPQTGYVTTAAPQAGGMTPQTANGAYQNYLNSTGYQFRVGEGMRALESSAFSRGAGQSGAAQKAALRFGQNIASDEFGRYLGYLGNQQGIGLSGASALAGVGQNYAGMVSANNQNAGDNAANAALIRGSANANMWNSIGGGLGNLLGSSYSIWGR